MPVYPSGGTIAQSAGSPGFGPAPTPSYNASASVRFNPADSARFSFTPTLQGNRTTFTWSGWVKRSLLTSRQMMFAIWPAAGRTDSNTITFEFDASDRIRVAGGLTQWLLTNAVFRDPSSWYHVQVTIDTTNATTTDRVIVYVNGVRQTTSAYAAPAQNLLTGWGLNGSPHFLGSLDGASIFLGGYLADVNYVDGLALTPSSFTSTDSNTGQLVPIQYTGAFGRNGFYLPFSGAALAVDLGQNPKTTGQDYPYWPMNTLLVETTNTNGQQNNTIVDSSTNNFTITRGLNATQGNFTPFNYGGGTAQANGYYSAYFDGTGDYAFVSGAGDSINFGTNDFTIEAWFNVLTLSTNFSIFDTCPLSTSSPTNRIIIRVNTSGALQYVTFQGVTVLITSSNSLVSTGTWNHVALVKNGGSTKLYLNGVQVGSTYSDSLNYPAQANRPILMGDGFNNTALGTGYISNLRVVKGTAVYTSNFTVPTTPLSAVTNTSLLTCQSSQFIDNSTNAATITTAGQTITVPTNPFGMTDWSGYFDGTGDYLTVASIGTMTGDFTYECWIFPLSTAALFLPAQIGSETNGRFYAAINTSRTINLEYFGVGTITLSNATVTANQWNHLAITRSGSTMYGFINGVLAGSTTSLTGTIGNAGSTFIGASSAGTAPINGNISNLRIVNGTALYTSNFTPPTAPLTAISGTRLLTCQSSTFIDNSTNAFSITVNGNSYTGTLNNPFNSPFNITPPRQAWSNYFDAPTTSGGGIIFNSSPNYALGTADFTVEGWWFPNRVAETTNPLNIAWFIGVVGNAGSSGGGVATDQIQYRGGGSPNQVQVTTNVTGWNHIAWVRQNGVMRVYLNGLIIGSGADTTNITAGEFQVGRAGTSTYRFSGYASNVRLVKGIALYTSNFTPPTSPLTAINGTVLLTCQSNRYIDNSIYRNFVQLVSTYLPNMSVSPVSPFFPTTSWSAASYGGSVLLDGVGDSLTIPASAQFNIAASESFTVECWVYNTSTLQQTIFNICDTGSLGYGSARVQIKNAAGSLQWLAGPGGSWQVNLDGFGNARQNTWTHLAFVRNGNTFLCFENGEQVATATYSNALVQDRNSFIGANSGTSFPFSGYISGFRFLKGVAVYTAPFTPPVQTFTNVANTSVLLNATNSGIYDATGTTAIETVGNAQVSTAVKKWGESSMYFDGTGDYLIIPPTPPAIATFGTADFTVEGWIYPTIVTATQNLMGNRIASTGANNWDLVITSASKLAWGTTSTNYLLSTSSLLVNTWQHIAVSRVSGTTRMFINGTLEATNTTVITLSANSQFNIASQGSFNATTSNFNGYMQDVRISKGVGRYSGNFTPPAAAFAYNQYDIGNQQWGPTNISVTAGIGQDNLVDSPSDYGTDTGLGGQVRGNYATMSPIDTVGGTFANGNLDVGVTAAAGRYIRATIAPPSGKWYWEATVLSTTGTPSVGVAATTAVPSGGVPVIGVTYSSNAVVTKDSTNLGTQTAWSVNNVVGIAYDADNLTIALYLNNALQTTVNLTTGYTYAPLFMSYANVTATSAVAFNFGQRAFAYAAPTGFKCLVSTNLPTVNGIGATSSTQADNYFDVTTYTGNGTTQSVLLPGAGFTPDFTWIKSRSSGTEWHVLCDSLRGPNKLIYSNSDTAEATVTNVLNSFDSGGFSVGFNSAYTSARTNTSAATYLGLAWRANGSSGATNNDGSITATVSANTTNGFSVVRYTGTGANGTIGHGLGKQLKFIMVKELSNTDSWLVWHIALPGTNYMVLNSQGASTAGATVWNSTVPSSSAPYVFSVGTNTAINQSGQQYVAYCFTDISSFSSMGSFVGNGLADGPMIYTGFKPAWFFTKKYTAVGAAQAWSGMNDVTLGYNTANYQLYLQTAGAEQTGGAGGYYDILSNGFKLRTNNIYDNNASDSYIYVAFAAFPFKYSRAY